MILFSSKASPFARKIVLAMYVLDIIRDVKIKIVDPRELQSENSKYNPLSKIPTLIVQNEVIHDSNVIIEYLNSLGEKILLPHDGMERIKFLTDYSLINETINSAVLVTNCNRFGHLGNSDSILVSQQKKRINRVLKYLENKKYVYKNFKEPNAIEISLACLLDYLDYRKPVEWIEIAPNLVEWIQEFAKSVPGYHKTLPPEVSLARWR